MSLITDHHPAKHAKSFYFAGKGLKHVFLNEANFRIHLVAGFFVVLLALFFNFSYLEWVLLSFTIGFVIITEILNSLIEELIDHLVQEHHESAGIIKDLSAATVLCASILSIVVGALLFIPKIVEKF